MVYKINKSLAVFTTVIMLMMPMILAQCTFSGIPVSEPNLFQYTRKGINECKSVAMSLELDGLYDCSECCIRTDLGVDLGIYSTRCKLLKTFEYGEVTLPVSRNTLDECQRHRLIQEFYGRTCGDCFQEEKFGTTLFTVECTAESSDPCWNSCVVGEEICSYRKVKECSTTDRCTEFESKEVRLGQCGVECLVDSDCGKGFDCEGYICDEKSIPFHSKWRNTIQECEDFRQEQMSLGKDCSPCKDRGGDYYRYGATCSEQLSELCFLEQTCEEGQTKCEGDIYYECTKDVNCNYWKPEKTIGKCGLECLQSSDCSIGTICLDNECISPNDVNQGEPNEPPLPSPIGFLELLNKFFEWLGNLFNSIFGLTITGADLVEPNTVESYNIELIASIPDSDWSDGTYEVQYANWALIDSDGNVVQEGDWERVYGDYFKEVTITTPNNPGDFAIVGVITQVDMAYGYSTGQWVSGNERILTKEAIDIESKVSIIEPETPQPGGFASLITAIINFLKNLFASIFG